MTLPGFRTEDQDGYVHPTGHRVGLHDVVFNYTQGFSPEMLLSQFPTLGLSLIHRTIAFYLDNREAIDEYVGRQEAEITRQRASAPKGPGVAELRRRLEALSQAVAS